MEYDDNPLANLDYLKSLSKAEISSYIKGYVMACTHLRECFTQVESELLLRLMESEADTDATCLLRFLDRLDELVSRKEASLRVGYPEIFVHR